MLSSGAFGATCDTTTAIAGGCISISAGNVSNAAGDGFTKGTSATESGFKGTANVGKDGVKVTGTNFNFQDDVADTLRFDGATNININSATLNFFKSGETDKKTILFANGSSSITTKDSKIVGNILAAAGTTTLNFNGGIGGIAFEGNLEAGRRGVGLGTINVTFNNGAGMKGNLHANHYSNMTATFNNSDMTGDVTAREAGKTTVTFNGGTLTGDIKAGVGLGGGGGGGTINATFNNGANIIGNISENGVQTWGGTLIITFNGTADKTNKVFKGNLGVKNGTGHILTFNKGSMVGSITAGANYGQQSLIKMYFKDGGLYGDISPSDYDEKINTIDVTFGDATTSGFLEGKIDNSDRGKTIATFKNSSYLKGNMQGSYLSRIVASFEKGTTENALGKGVAGGGSVGSDGKGTGTDHIVMEGKISGGAWNRDNGDGNKIDFKEGTSMKGILAPTGGKYTITFEKGSLYGYYKVDKTNTEDLDVSLTLKDGFIDATSFTSFQEITTKNAEGEYQYKPTNFAQAGQPPRAIDIKGGTHTIIIENGGVKGDIYNISFNKFHSTLTIKDSLSGSGANTLAFTGGTITAQGGGYSGKASNIFEISGKTTIGSNVVASGNASNTFTFSGGGSLGTKAGDDAGDRSKIEAKAGGKNTITISNVKDDTDTSYVTLVADSNNSTTNISKNTIKLLAPEGGANTNAGGVVLNANTITNEKNGQTEILVTSKRGMSATTIDNKKGKLDITSSGAINITTLNQGEAGNTNTTDAIANLRVNNGGSMTIGTLTQTKGDTAINANGGSVTITTLTQAKGKITITATNKGNIKLDELTIADADADKDAMITSDGGNVEIGNFTQAIGKTTIATQSGKAILKNLNITQGELFINSSRKDDNPANSSGEINIDSLINAGSGDITIQSSGGNIVLNKIALSGAGGLNVTMTNNGKLLLKGEKPTGVDTTLDIKLKNLSITGSAVDDSKENLLKPSFAQNNTVIDLVSNSGDEDPTKVTGRDFFKTLTIGDTTGSLKGENGLFRLYMDANAKKIKSGVYADSDGSTGMADIIKVDNVSGDVKTHYIQVQQKEGSVSVGSLTSKNIVVAIVKEASKGEKVKFDSAGTIIGFDLITVNLSTDRVKVGPDGSVTVNPDTGADHTRYIAGDVVAKVAPGTTDGVETALGLGYNIFMSNINSLNKRMGELRGNANSQGVWARVFSGKEISNITDLAVESSYTTFQAGYDYSLGGLGANNYIGFALGYGMLDSESEESIKAGSNFNGFKAKSRHFEVGIYNAYVADSGLYTDTIAKFANISNTLTPYNLKDYKIEDTSEYALSLSQEVGYRIKMPNKAFYIDPQAELSLGYLSGSSINENLSGRIIQGESDSIIALRARVGGAVGYSLKRMNKAEVDLRLGGYYVHDYTIGGDKSMTTATATAKKDFNINDSRFVVNVGTNIKMSKSTRIYVDLEKSYGGKINTDYLINAGVRYSFGQSSYAPLDSQDIYADKEVIEQMATRGLYVEVLSTQGLSQTQKDLLKNHDYKVQNKNGAKSYLIGSYTNKNQADNALQTLKDLANKLGGEAKVVEVE